ncbi:MAG: AAA family ATPase [Xanthomonadaceae bacterium]|nr:AAA family ATPase [Xanthomonadaceae bacterium]
MSSSKIPAKKNKANEEQLEALTLLSGTENIFLTGSAGTGKTFVIKEYLKQKTKKPPVLASTGAAAVLLGGRTFHSFFGLGIMEGGIDKTVAKAAANSRVSQRIEKTKEVIIDEISMIHPAAFEAADRIAKTIRKNDFPFGGLRLILTGDFFQLPPVDRFANKTSWLFNHPLWNELEIQKIILRRSMRTANREFEAILDKIRYGICDEEVTSFLDSKRKPLTENFTGTVLFARKNEVETYNQKRLDELKGKLHEFETSVVVSSRTQTPREKLIDLSPLPHTLQLKEGALVMIRRNDESESYVNGSLGIVKKIAAEEIDLELMNGMRVTVEKEDFHVLDGDGKVSATITNFPLTLGWAATIHKSQGASIDSLHINLKNLWEYGQAYVAISRAKNPHELFISDWSKQSIKADSDVLEYYQD